MSSNKIIQNLFIKLVKIDSCSGQEKELADFVVDKLKKLNLIVKKDKFGNIIAKPKKFNKKDSILVCAHLDTITSNKEIVPKIKKGVIYSDEKKILGADNKAAITEIIYTLEKIKNNYSNFELLFTVQEETALIGIKNLDKKLIKSKVALVLDYNFPVGFMVLSSPAAVILKIKIFGKETHSARKLLGINAIELACQCIDKFKPKEQKGLSYNIGIIKGGTAINVVPGCAEIGLSIRADFETKLSRFAKKLEGHFRDIVSKKGGRLLISQTRVGFAYSHKRSDEFIKDLVKRFKGLGIKVKLEKTLGLSDANVLNHFGIKTIELGYGPRNVHTNKESIAIKEMEKMVELLIGIFYKPKKEKTPNRGYGTGGRSRRVARRHCRLALLGAIRGAGSRHTRDNNNLITRKG